MKNATTLYHIVNALSFFGMLLLFLDAVRLFENWNWFNVDYPFWGLMIAMMLVMFRAKKLNPRQVNPNILFPISKYAYFAGVGSFLVGYVFLEKYSVGQQITFGLAVLFELISTIVTYLSMNKAKVK